MAIAIIVFVILIILLIFLTEKIEIQIISKNRLTVNISSVLFTVSLSNFKKRKKARRKSALPANYAAFKFLLSRAEFSFDELSISKAAHPVLRAVISALFSTVFAYFDTEADKLNMPNNVSSCDSPFAFDIRIKARLYTLISAFIIYKIKMFGKGGSQCRIAK